MRRVGWLAFLVGCLFPDLGTLATDAGSDATNDVTSNDGGGDGGVDAHVGFCASLTPAATFCDDFDDGGAIFDDAGNVLAPWSSAILTSSTGTIALDPTTTSSPPFALLTRVVDPGTPAAALVKTFGASALHVTLALDAYVARVEPAATGNIMSLVFDDGSLGLQIVDADGGCTVLDGYNLPDAGAQFATIGPTFALPLARWVRIVETIDVGASTIVVSLDAGTGPVVVVSTQTPQQLAGKSPRVHVGIDYADTQSAGWIVYYDNVAVTTN